MTEHQKQISNKELLEDLKRVDQKTEGSLTIGEYREKGNYSIYPFQDRWGCWNEAKKKLGLEYTERGEALKKTEEEVLQSIREVAEKVGEPVTTKEYREHGTSSALTISKKFGSWKEGCEKAGVESYDVGELRLEEERVDIMEENLKEKRGRMKLDKFVNILTEETGKKLKKRNIPPMIERLNDRENGLTVTKSSNGGTETKVFIENDSIGMYDKYYEVLPEGTRMVFDAVMQDSSGKSPQAIAAAIKYIYGKPEGTTQRDVMEEVSVSEVTLRKAYQYLEEKGYEQHIEAAREGNEE